MDTKPVSDVSTFLIIQYGKNRHYDLPSLVGHMPSTGSWYTPTPALPSVTSVAHCSMAWCTRACSVQVGLVLVVEHVYAVSVVIIFLQTVR